VCGKDFKTGQTLIEDNHRARSEVATAWASRLVLDQHPRNRDGEVLDDPESFRPKRVEAIGPRIHPAARRLSDALQRLQPHSADQLLSAARDNKEGWDNIDIFGWLGYPMQIKIDFLCRDSILAAPIVLDLRCSWILRSARACAASRNGCRFISRVQ